MSVHGPILKNLLFHPHRTFVVDDRKSYCGAELLIGAMHVAQAIRSRCESGTVGVMVPTSGAFPICALAGWIAGKVVVPLNYLLKQDELQYVIDNCECDTIISLRQMLDFTGFTPKVKNIIKLDDLNFKSVPEPMWPHSPEDSDLAVLLYTSGTSGKPKGVMLTHANLAGNVRQIRNWINIAREFVFLGVLPQFHSFGLTALTLLPLTSCSKVVYTARFVPNKIMKLMREHRPKVFIAIPSMYNALLHAKDATREDWSSVEYIVSGGEPLPQVVFDGFRGKFGVTINEGYGLTETSPVTNWCRPDEWRPHSVGHTLPELELRIIDPATGKSLGPNHDGEVQFKGVNVMRGYYKLPEQTADTFTRDGYFKTGDMGRTDMNGHLFITGRIKEMLIVGGENVFPREIEEVLNKHEVVKDSGVVGKMDPMRGELPVAFVELREAVDPKTFDANSLRSWCRQSLAGYKVPDEVRVLEALPRNATGKIMRRELKKML